jgi:hypothetical protein
MGAGYVKVNNATPREEVNLRVHPMSNGIAEVRFWCNNKLIDVQRLKNSDLNTVHFSILANRKKILVVVTKKILVVAIRVYLI